MDKKNFQDEKFISFRQLGLPECMMRSIEEKDFEKPTEIQEKSIPLVIQGKDVIAKASTGSGKTLAFSSVILKDVKKDFGIQALVLTPTRELAEQVANGIAEFSGHSRLNIIPVYGGVSIGEQIRRLKNAEVVVGTPGRMLDHINRRTINLEELKILVLDEADRMLDMGFIDDVEKIISNCPKKRQTMLFSATISKDIVRLSRKYMHESIEVSAEEYVDPTKLTQVYYQVENRFKFSLLKHLLEKEKSKLVMVFCNTRRRVDSVSYNLNLLHIKALPIHGGFSQDKRSKVMKNFHSQSVRVLICTDIAARGLDIPEVTHIYNYETPSEPKDYIHRIGRTARAGEEGKAISLVDWNDAANFDKIIKTTDIEVKEEQTPQLENIPVKMPERKSSRNWHEGRPRFERNQEEGYRSRRGYPERHRKERSRGSRWGGGRSRRWDRGYGSRRENNR